MSKLFMVVNEDRFFLSHRKPIALAARDANYDVVIIAKVTGHRAEIEALGFRFIPLTINPTGMNPIQELRTLRFLYALYKKECPDIVHHVGIKNILWGGIAAKLTKIKGVVNAVSGLGGLFNEGKISIAAKVVLRIIKYSNSRPGVKVIFQNNDDKGIFISHKAVRPQQIKFIKGSGIDLDDFAYEPEPDDGKINIIFTARMVKEKGVCDLIDAAHLLQEEFGEKVKFLLCGRLTPNKSGVDETYMKENCDGVYIEWLGERSDIKTLLKLSHIMAFPSYYREGVPKSLIEACAIGRPIVTCDSTGCRDVVDDGINGFLVAPKKPIEIAEKLKVLINEKELRQKLGIESRQKAEKEFSIESVITKHLLIYQELLSS